MIFQGNLVIDGWGISCEIALIWMSADFTDDQSTLATSHYLRQCWPRSLTPYGVTRPQWVNFEDNLGNLEYSSKHNPGMNARDLIDDESTMIQVMAWCCQATSQCLYQCYPDLCHYMGSLGHDKLIHFGLWMPLWCHGSWSTVNQVMAQLFEA